MMNFSKNCQRIAVAIFVLILSVGSSSFAQSNGGQGNGGWLTSVDFKALHPALLGDLRQEIVNDIDAAKNRIDAAFFHLEDEAIAHALVRASQRGVKVRIVGDDHHRTQAGFAILESGNINPVYGNGELLYLPDPTLSPLLVECQTRADYRICTSAGAGHPGSEYDNLMVRHSDYNLMSHTFILIDAITIWNLATPFTSQPAHRVGWRMQSEAIMRSFEREFQQMHGGVFATTLSVYNGPLKSLTQKSPVYQTDKGTMRILFNPQERLVKTVIDEVYRARASVFVVTEDLANPWLLDALEYKRQNGFDVRILVGPNQSPTMHGRVMSLGAVQASSEAVRLPTMILIDSELDRFNNRQPRLVQVLSHPLWRAAPFEVELHDGADRVLIYPADTFVDGSLWEIVESGSVRNPQIDQFLNLWKNLWDREK